MDNQNASILHAISKLEPLDFFLLPDDIYLKLREESKT